MAEAAPTSRADEVAILIVAVVMATAVDNQCRWGLREWSGVDKGVGKPFQSALPLSK